MTADAKSLLNADPQQSWWVLRIVFGAMAVLSGLDKYFNIMVDWSRYLWSFVPTVLNIAPDTFMFFVGAVEVLVGIAIFTRYTQYAAVVLSLWLLAIALNLVLAGFWDIAARDVGLATGAFVLAMLSPAPEAQVQRRRTHAPA